MKKNKEDEDDDIETSLFNPRDIDAKNAPAIERTFPTVMEKKTRTNSRREGILERVRGRFARGKSESEKV